MLVIEVGDLVCVFGGGVLCWVQDSSGVKEERVSRRERISALLTAERRKRSGPEGPAWGTNPPTGSRAAQPTSLSSGLGSGYRISERCGDGNLVG